MLWISPVPYKEEWSLQQGSPEVAVSRIVTARCSRKDRKRTRPDVGQDGPDVGQDGPEARTRNTDHDMAGTWTTD